MRLFLSLILVLACGLEAQTTQPIQFGNVVASSTATVIDNRSQAYRRFDYHGFCATGTGTWSVTIQYSDVSSAGPWTSFTGQSVTVTNLSARCNGFGLGYRAFLRFNITGQAVVSYTGTRSFNFPISDVASLSATSPLLYNGSTGVFSIQTASSTLAGALLAADWTTFNSKIGTTTANTYTAGAKQSFVPSATLAGINFGSRASAPSVPLLGDVYFDTTLSRTGVYDGTQWRYTLYSPTTGTGVLQWNGSALTAATLTPSQLGQQGAALGNVVTWNGSIWAPAAPTGGSTFSYLPVRTSPTVLTLPTTLVNQFSVGTRNCPAIASSTITLASGTGDAVIVVNQNCGISVYTDLVATCSSCSLFTGTLIVPSGNLTLYTWSAVTGSWNATGTAGQVSGPVLPLVFGSGLGSSCSSGVCTVTASGVAGFSPIQEFFGFGCGGGSAGPSGNLVTNITGSCATDFAVYSFAASGTPTVYITTRYPTGATALDGLVRWYQNDGSGGAGTVRMTWAVSCSGVGSSTTYTYGTSTVTDTTPPVAGNTITQNSATGISLSGCTAGQTVKVRLQRDTSVGGNYVFNSRNTEGWLTWR